MVVGPAGQEIHTDKYGRVKLQFHWDRYGRRDEHSSCWVRVSSPWASKYFGFVQIPRIGQEVVVDFLEGDPDQPLITGRVYNAEQMPPWELPANATPSDVLTRSSRGGAYNHANALRFEDKKSEEQLWIHAEKNQDIEVQNDETHWVGHDRAKTVDHDENVTIHNNAPSGWTTSSRPSRSAKTARSMWKAMKWSPSTRPRRRPSRWPTCRTCCWPR
jgi:type VI secretion system secreted protein VgrG